MHHLQFIGIQDFLQLFDGRIGQLGEGGDAVVVEQAGDLGTNALELFEIIGFGGHFGAVVSGSGSGCGSTSGLGFRLGLRFGFGLARQLRGAVQLLRDGLHFFVKLQFGGIMLAEHRPARSGQLPE